MAIHWTVEANHKELTPGYTCFFRFESEVDAFIRQQHIHYRRYGLTNVKFVKRTIKGNCGSKDDARL